MKILNASALRMADELTIEKQHLSSWELMERASKQVFNWLHGRLQGAPVTIHVFCGVGNNGGDGLAVARLLAQHGYTIEVYIVSFSDQRSKDFITNLTGIKNMKIWPKAIHTEEDFPELTPNDIVIDAIFGIGLNRAPKDWVASLLMHINGSGSFVLSIDIPSGLFMDRVPEDPKAVIVAHQVLSFQTPKLVFFLPQTGIYVKNWEVLDIGLDLEYLASVETTSFYVDKNMARGLYKVRDKFSHKGTYGHVLMVGGSYGKIGSMVLSSEAALNSGAGLVTSFLPSCGYTIMQTAMPEVMVITDANEKKITQVEYDFTPSSVGIGMGMGTAAETVRAFSEFLTKISFPIVIDADALNILASHPELLRSVPENSVLTPHPKELERLVGEWKNDFEKLKKVREFSKRYKVIVVIKGAHTITIFQKKGLLILLEIREWQRLAVEMHSRVLLLV